jgi:hypothetical protein
MKGEGGIFYSGFSLQWLMWLLFSLILVCHYPALIKPVTTNDCQLWVGRVY